MEGNPWLRIPAEQYEGHMKDRAAEGGGEDNHMRRTPYCFLLALLLSCAHGYRFTRTTSTRVAPREPTCSIDVLTTVPQRPYQELGYLDYFERAAGNASDFRDQVRPLACKAHGQAVIARINAFGGYSGGTVIVWRAGSTDGPDDADE
jgi:hypothetical protein